MKNPHLPVSCVNPFVGLIGVISFFIALIAMKHYALLGSIESVLFLYAAYIIPIIITSIIKKPKQVCKQ